MKKFAQSLYFNLIILFFLPITIYLLCISVFSTSYVAWNEVIFFTGDNIGLNVLAVLISLGIITIIGFLVNRGKLEEKLTTNKRLFIVIKISLLFLLFTISLIWVFSTRFLPFGDSDWLHTSAQEYSQGIYTAFENGWFNYIDLYPFQTRTLVWYVLIDKLAGGYSLMVYQVINCFCLTLLYLSLSMLARLIEAGRLQELLVVFVGIIWIPGILYTSFVYGNLIGFSLCLFSLVLWLYYFKNGRLILALFAGVTFAIAFCFKSNLLIYLVAMVLYGIFKMLYQKDYKKIIGIVLLFVFLIPALLIPKAVTEARTGIKLSEGMSGLSWIDMGLKESTAGPGWYTDDSKLGYKDAGFNKAAHDEITKENIANSISGFADNKAEAVQFFIRKTASMWNEPTMQSFWILRSSDRELSPGLTRFTSYQGYSHIVKYIDIIHILLILGTFLYIVFLRKDDFTFEKLILPMVFVGFFLFHLVWEAKAQYAFFAWTVMIPVALCGYGKLALLFKKKDNKPESQKGVTIFKIVLISVSILFLAFLTVKGHLKPLSMDNYAFEEYIIENFG